LFPEEFVLLSSERGGFRSRFKSEYRLIPLAIEMSSSIIARLLFAAAVVCLLVSGVGGSILVYRLSTSGQLLSHTYTVQIAIGEVDGTLASAARARFGYVNSGDAEQLTAFKAAKAQLNADLQHVRELTADNPTQQYLCTRLENLAHRRIDLLQSSVDLKTSGHSTDPAQAHISRDGVNVTADVVSVIHEMQDEQERALGEKGRISGAHLDLTAGALVALFVLGVFLFWLQNRMLMREIEDLQGAASSGSGRPSPLKIEPTQMPRNVYNLANKK